MNSKEYKEMRQQIGSWESVASLLGVHWRTIARRESGELPITIEAERSILTLKPVWLKEPPPLPVIRDGAEVRHIPGYIGYAASTDGRVFSCRSKCPNRKYPYKAWEEIKSTKGSRGYWIIALNGSSRKQFKLHHVILNTFAGPRPHPWYQGRHLNDNKDQNHLENLAWGTPRENRLDMTRNGRMPNRKGSKHPMAKLSEKDVFKIRHLRRSGLTLREIGKQFNVSEAMICRIAKNRSWTHLG